ncbi:MAG: hypothetical protein ACPGTU_10485 [Myxococcota bacterium]
MTHLLALFLGCAAHRPDASPVTMAAEPEVVLASVHPVAGVKDVSCDEKGCIVVTQEGSFRLGVNSMNLTPLESVVTADPQPSGTSAIQETPALDEQWNTQISNGWRSPFRREIPTAGGGQMRMVRGLTPGTSRIVRTGGGLQTRPAPDPSHLSYPRTLALHPTGQEAYLIVWPNSLLTAFSTKTLDTTWNLDLEGSAVGLFVTKEGRYLLAETGGEAPSEQLLDYESDPIAATPGTDPIANHLFPLYVRPQATHTVVVDLSLGDVIARLPGPAAGMSSTPQGILVASTQAVSWIPRTSTD